MKVVWTAGAVRDLKEIWKYVADDKPEAARRLVASLREASQLLAEQPHLGRAGRVPHTREFVVAGTPYILVYRRAAERIEIVAALHGARIR